MRHADRIGHLHLATLGDAGGDDVLGDVARGVGGRTVDLGRVLAGERAAAVAGHAAVGVDDDLAAGQAAVADRPADHELAGRVDVHLVLRQSVQPLLRQHGLEDELTHAFDEVGVLDLRIVLGGQDHSVEAGHLVCAVVAQRDLRLRVRAQPRQLAGLAHLGLLFDEAVRVVDRRGHEFRRLGAGVAEHQALVAGALFFGFLAVHALVDVRRLLADQVQHAAGGAVEADLRGVVADVENDLARERLQVDPGAGRDLAGDDRDAGLDHGFAGHACALVLREDRVENGVGNLVGDLVGMALGYGFGSEVIAVHLGLLGLGFILRRG